MPSVLTGTGIVPEKLRTLTKSNEMKTYTYKCECGNVVELFTDMKPDKLIKCFKCQSKIKLGVRDEN